MSVEATIEARSSTRRTWVAVLVLTIPYLLALAVMQAVFLGLGVSFLLFGLPIMRIISPDSKTRAWLMYLSIGWLMVSWWPHIGMHVSNAPDDLQRLIYIDYLFHVPLMIADAVLAYCFFSLVRQRVRGPVVPR